MPAPEIVLADVLLQREALVGRLGEGRPPRDFAGLYVGADDLCFSERTVKNVVHDLLTKLNCRTRAQAVALATRQGVI